MSTYDVAILTIVAILILPIAKLSYQDYYVRNFQPRDSD